MIPNIGGPELIILLVIVLLLFGAKRIPELAKGLGTGVREFRRGTSGQNDEVEGEKSEKKNEDEEVLDRENAKAESNTGSKGETNTQANADANAGAESEGTSEGDSENGATDEKSSADARQEQRG